MTNRQDIIAKAQSFLQVVFTQAQARLGEHFKIKQETIWWSIADPSHSEVRVQSSGPSTMSQSGGHQREVVNSFGVGTFYQAQLMDNSFPEQNDLHDTVTASGIPTQLVPRGFLLPLVLTWCKLSDPFDLTQPAAQVLLDEFADAVIEQKSTTTYLDAMVYLELGGDPLVLEEGVIIRPISEEELWDLSQPNLPISPYTIQFSPSDSWSVLEIRISHGTDEGPRISGTIYRIREAVIASLALVMGGNFILLPVGMNTNFGSNALGRSTQGGTMPREFGSPFPARPITLSADARQELMAMWPGVKEIMTSDSHELALPVRRLIDGLGRRRYDDTIIDYSIGLESLLLNVRDELRYRFSLRGASVLADPGEDKKQEFEELRDLYDARSAIVHGQDLSGLNLHAIRSRGETFLRDVWKWFFRQGLPVEEARKLIDDGILS